MLTSSRSLGALILLVGLGPSAAPATPIQWRVEDGGNGHWYEIVGDYPDASQRWTWQTSKSMAENMAHSGAQGHLVTIRSQQENNWLIATFFAVDPWPTWIGLTDSEAFGGVESSQRANPKVDGWVWVTGEPVSFNAWVDGRPDNTNDEDFVLIGSSWGLDTLWNDGQGNWDAQFLVEFEPLGVPDSAPFTAFLTGLSLAVARRWWPVAAK